MELSLDNLGSNQVHEPLPQEASLEVARSVLEQANTSYEQGNLEAALRKLIKVIPLFEEARSQVDLINCQLLQGKIEREKGKLEEASSFFTTAKQIASQSHHNDLLIDALNLEASILSAKGHDIQAIEQLEKTLDLAKEFGFVKQQANIHSNLGTLFNLLGDYGKSLEHLTYSYDLHRSQSQQDIGEAITLMLLGFLYNDMGDQAKARQFHLEARELASALGNTKIEVASLNNLGDLSHAEGRLIEAKRSYTEALKIASEAGYKRYVIDNLNGLGIIQVELCHYPNAIKNHSEALRFARDIGDLSAQQESAKLLGKAYLVHLNIDQALFHFEQSLFLAKQIGHPKAQFEIHSLLSQGFEKQGNTGAALQHLKEAITFDKQIFNEESDKKTRLLTVKFDLERAHHQAEEFRLRTEIEHDARLKAEKMVEERTRELAEANLEVVMRLAVAAEYRDDDTGEHTKRVGRTAAAIAYVLGCPIDEVELIFRAARLHDVGKIGVSDSILFKPNKLTDEEFDLMRTHTIMGGRILANGQTKLLKLAESIALCHHERWDGKGYPNKLSGNKIPLTARIVSVADVLDALTHERPYKKAWSVEETLIELEKNSGSQFDPNVVNACLSIFGK